MATIEQTLQKRRIQRQKEERICRDFVKLRKEYPNAPVTAVFDQLAYNYRQQGANICGMPFPSTGQQIRNILVKNGYYQPKTTKSDESE